MTGNTTQQRRNETRVNLLQAISSSPELTQRLGLMPADRNTLSCAVDGAEESFSHPTLELTPSDRPLQQTLDPPVDTVYELSDVDEGFVPRRRIVHLGESVDEQTDYRLVGRLGSGGTGIVYQAHQRAIDREVAIKMLRKEFLSNPQSRERFLTEARVVGGLDHPNVIALHEVFVDPSCGLYYSMKRIDGTSWDQKIDEMSVNDNVETFLRVCNAIRYAHSRGLIHRDIKPENVMLGAFGEVLLADWGLAVNADAVDASGSTIGGTPAYMAPELAAGDPSAIAFATDVYLLGATLFQILTGMPPHHGESLLECIHAAARNEIRATDVEGELMDIALTAMATAPEDRYRSVADLIQSLHDHRQHQQSIRLVQRARERMTRATAEKHYEDFRMADALLREAIEIWPENKRAIEAVVALQLSFAQAASSRGDLDLALSLYESLGQPGAEGAERIRGRIAMRNSSQQRESKYSTLFMDSPEAGLLTDMSNGKVLEANLAFVSLLGYAEDELVGRPVAELRLWRCEERRQLFVQQLQEHRGAENFEAPLVRKDGTPVAVLISSRATIVNDQEVVVSTLRDISERKDAENKLKRSQQRLRDLQQLAGLGTWSWDVLTESVQWSKEAFRLVGRAPEQGVPNVDEFLEIVHPDDRDLLLSTKEQAVRDGAAYEIRVRLRGAGARYRTLMMRGQPIFDDDGNTVEVYGVMIRTGDSA